MKIRVKGETVVGMLNIRNDSCHNPDTVTVGESCELREACMGVVLVHLTVPFIPIAAMDIRRAFPFTKS